MSVDPYDSINEYENILAKYNINDQEPNTLVAWS